jgi:WD40 repeat protein
MASAAKIEPIQSLQNTLVSNKIEQLLTCSNVGSLFAFLSESSQLFTFNLETQAFSLLRPPAKSKSFTHANCLDISDNLQHIATGHDDGSVNIWCLTTNAHLTGVQKSQYPAPITRITFPCLPNIVFASDCMGKTRRIEYSKSLFGWSVTETDISHMHHRIPIKIRLFDQTVLVQKS